PNRIRRVPTGSGQRAGREEACALRAALVALELFARVAVFRPLLECLVLLGLRELPLERIVIRVRAEVLQFPGNLGVLCLLATTSHELPPHDFSLGTWIVCSDVTYKESKPTSD